MQSNALAIPATNWQVIIYGDDDLSHSAWDNTSSRHKRLVMKSNVFQREKYSFSFDQE